MAANTFTNRTRLSRRIWKVVEDDRFGQFPFMYVILGEDKCILIDTGCGTSNYLQYVNTHINKNKLPYLIVNTHVHFDHVGGNHQFENTPGFLGTCMSGRAKTFTQNYELNSLALAHHGANLQPFKIDRWLDDGDLIFLNDTNPDPEQALRVILTPGHTPDSLALYLPCENRLFLGDSVYPWTAIHVDCLGSSPKEYYQSIENLVDIIDKIEAELLVKPISSTDSTSSSAGASSTDSASSSADSTSSSTGAPSTDATTSQQEPIVVPESPSAPEPVVPVADDNDELKTAVISQFYTAVGLLPYEAREIFDVRALLEISDWDLESAVEMYLSNSDAIGMLCPPKATPSAAPQSGASSTPAAASPSAEEEIPPVPAQLSISCGHVTENLPAEAIRQIQQALIDIKAGEVPPSNIDDGIAEYLVGDGQYTLLLPFEAKWE